MPASATGSNAGEVLMRCLLVDDTRPSSKPRALFLARMGHGHRHGIEHGRGVAAGQRTATDFILVDVEPGDENGFDLARRLAESHTRELAVIMISSDAVEDYADLVAESPHSASCQRPSLFADGIRRVLGKAR
jgi:CheY-like chemotaxis protein